jgi:hypothetical protein
VLRGVRENGSGPAGCGRGAATRGAAPWRPPAAAEAATAGGKKEGKERAAPGSAARMLHCGAVQREIPSPRQRRAKTLARPVRPPRRLAGVRRGAAVEALEELRKEGGGLGREQAGGRGDVVKT